ncbi:hypothetical protein FIBSPDRAFT_158466 [Athelia psychrophila]|uniref:Uncharacterized protein n=1 Tax=Athelia psychrophila TaxID=1759441 RepID=A0A166B7T6_9AGAM|nr:hypothetical protein FIBSPDRAFT_158466 [Fibularhizoctonia sp. CBS 109695]
MFKHFQASGQLPILSLLPGLRGHPSSNIHFRGTSSPPAVLLACRLSGISEQAPGGAHAHPPTYNA